ncbi:MAG: amino acid ABC transporter substrate-binding protein [Zoogloeaceae bacterium]|jgi:glutamate/aspartate transport system substrate-binding protein|nr:amino acid ABC transporter substrate-binding protein [Zoogloeaceae bacterium]
MNRLLKFARALGMVVGLGLSASVPAQEVDTLAKIRATGEMVLGVQEYAVPFSYLDLNGNSIGYSVTLCQGVAAFIRKQFAMPGLALRYHFVNRGMPTEALKAGEVDLVCSSFGNTTRRQQEVGFSLNFFYSGLRMLVRRNSKIQKFDDLSGKRLVVSMGSTSEQAVHQKIEREGWKVTVLLGKNHAESFRMVRSGRADAFVLDDALLAGIIATSRDPNAYRITGEPLWVEPYALMLRKGDTVFKRVVDSALREMMRSGKVEKIYANWFLEPLPPRGIKLNIPMSEWLKDALKNPSDRGVE